MRRGKGGVSQLARLPECLTTVGAAVDREISSEPVSSERLGGHCPLGPFALAKQSGKIW